jgi:hypothetical protein
MTSGFRHLSSEHCAVVATSIAEIRFRSAIRAQMSARLLWSFI